MIESNSVVIIHGATGSGKSTQLPQYVLDHCLQRSAHCNIVVTQPRKIGASSIARWISRERGWVLGGLVGYQVSFPPCSLCLCCRSLIGCGLCSAGKEDAISCLWSRIMA